MSMEYCIGPKNKGQKKYSKSNGAHEKNTGASLKGLPLAKFRIDPRKKVLEQWMPANSAIM